MLDVTWGAPNDGDVPSYDAGTDSLVMGPPSAGAPDDATYLVATSDPGLSSEVVVGAAPGGELGGTWAAPTVDAVHSGSSHAAVQAAAEATAAAALTAHLNDAADAHDAAAISVLDAANDFTATDVEGVLAELQSDAETEASVRASADSALDTRVDALEVAPPAHVHAGEDITSGTVADARIATTIARDSEVSSAISTSEAGQVRDGDAAGGVLSGTYPNPSFASDMATQAELDAHINDTTDAHDASAVSFTPAGSITATDVQAAIEEVAAGGGGGGHDFDYETRSSNTILGTGDVGKVIDITATITQTLTAAATLGDKWWVILRNATTDGTTVVTLDPNSSETVDGLTTAKMYSGEARLIICNGSNFTTVMLSGGFAKFTPGSSTFVVPAGITTVDVVCIGGGGQGGGGPSSAATAKNGGTGGGGGAVSRAALRATDLGAAGTGVTVTVGAGGSGSGAGGTGGGTGSNGADGAQTTFGTLLKAGGGAQGRAGTIGNQIGGAGGSPVASGAFGGAGSPSSATPIGAQAANSNTSGNNPGICTEWGGASGGGSGTGNGTTGAGGSSIYGGAGGGAGGSCSTTSPGNAGNGGGTQSYTAGSGPAGGTIGAGQAGVNGSFTGPYCGQGGSGGAAAASGTAGKGGDGGIGSGGGGGGAALSSGTGGAGGDGGAGECRVWYS